MACVELIDSFPTHSFVIVFFSVRTQIVYKTRREHTKISVSKPEATELRKLQRDDDVQILRRELVLVCLTQVKQCNMLCRWSLGFCT